MVSFAFRVHLSPCATGRCASAPMDTCHDRVLDGNEADVDCGGICATNVADGGHCIEATDWTAARATARRAMQRHVPTESVTASRPTSIAAARAARARSASSALRIQIAGPANVRPPCTDTICIDDYSRCQ